MKRHTIRFTLFLTYSAIILVTFITVVVVFTSIEVPKQKKQVFSSLTQSCANVTASMDREFDQMRTFALNIAYSTLVRDRFAGYMSRDMSTYEKGEEAKVLGDLLTALICPNRPVDQITLYTPQGDIVRSGLLNGAGQGHAADQPWYDQVISSQNNTALIYSGADAQLSKYFTGEYGKLFATFALQNFDNFNNSQGYIEIKRSLSKIITAAINYESVYGEALYIFDGNGTLVFPLHTTPPSDLFASARTMGFPSVVTKLSDGSDSNFLVCSASVNSNFCTIAVIKPKQLYSTINSYIAQIAFISVAALLLAIILAYFAAKRLTTPIGIMCREVADFDLTHPVPPVQLETSFIELKTLYHNFCEMREKLLDSMRKQLMLQNQEMQSRMLALQSQMNPHFLYNSLSAIQSMADEGMNKDIIIMCQSMSSILRYISSDREQEVPLREELRYTKDYLLCMVIRYQGDLSYSIQIPEEMNDIKVPKLCVQLLVENAIKFTSANRPPYHVSISAAADSKHFEITVRDNGPGFSKEMLEVLHAKIEQIDATGLLPTLEIDGMGLMNVYIRFKLIYNGGVIFRLENNPTHGACITIGEFYEQG